MHILGIDTSFDDTAAAVVSAQTILSNVLSSQLPMYQQWGGVVPRLARENHEQNIAAVIGKALSKAHLSWKQIDAIAITQGPGLAITLEVGLAKAKELSLLHRKPLVAINHLEGHLLSVLAQPKTAGNHTVLENIFPALAILVSGGTTQFVFVSEIGNYEILGETQDDALGEAFDKVGRMLGLGYPAGALVEKLALTGRKGQVVFPIPMQQTKSADTSFSGLKTAAQRIIAALKEKHGGNLSKQDICDIALGFQTACIQHLTQKFEFALALKSPKTIILGGGVASNVALRSKLRQILKQYQLPLLCPYTKKLCVDNAAMIALAGYFNALRGNYVTDTTNLDRLPNARLGPSSHLHSN